VRIRLGGLKDAKSMNIGNRVLIRRLEAEDVSAILEITCACRREYGLEGRVDSILEPTDYAILEVYRRERSSYFVAVIDGNIAGGGGIAPLGGANPQTCELQRMYLRPENRHLRVGHALLAGCIEQAKRYQFEYCYAETICEMVTALSFYERHGFRRLAAPVGRTGHGPNNRWMMLNIAGSYWSQESWSI
jgi:putative acetyltransferase